MKIFSSRVYLEEVFQTATIEIKDNKIINVSKTRQQDIDFDYGTLRIFPGFIDIHAHGNSTVEANFLTEEGLESWQKKMVLEGVTSFLVTTSTAPHENLENSFQVAAKGMKKDKVGAEILGIHVEGPFISFNKKGAHNPYLITEPKIEILKKWQHLADNQIKLVCVAPEMDYSHEFIKYCKNHNIKVALGHTSASYEETLLALDDGAIDFTHTFNAMPTLHHRQPGAVAAALSEDRAYAELIGDGIHVHPAVCKMVARAKGKDKLILVSDSTALKGCAAGEYKQGHRQDSVCYVRENGKIELSDGTLAGGSCKINEMLYRTIVQMGIDEITAYNAVTINPATMLDLSNKGKIAVDMDADITILNDDYSVHDVFCLGVKQ